jgi:hypothetical protein
MVMELQQSQTPNVDKLPLEIKQQAVEAGAAARSCMDRATSHQQHASAGDSATSHGGNREAMMHVAGAPGKSQEALSPTDSHKGQSHTQHRHIDRGRGIER